MKKWKHLDRTLTPDGKDVSLYEHDGEYAIRVNGMDLMSTREHGSEDHLAEVACASLTCKKNQSKNPRILIGGLGFGFTLNAVLKTAPSSAQVIVAEVLEAVIRWNRDPQYGLSSTLADTKAKLRGPKLQILHADVQDVIRQNPGGFDSILMDVDNGPSAFTLEQNGSLYGKEGLKQIKAALRPNGVVAFWSAFEDGRFLKILHSLNGTVSVHPCRSRGKKGAHHWIYLLSQR